LDRAQPSRTQELTVPSSLHAPNSDELGRPDVDPQAPTADPTVRAVVWPAFAVLLGVAVVPMLLTAFVPALQPYGLRLKLGDSILDPDSSIMSPGSPGRLLSDVLWLLLGGMAAAVVARGKATLETMLGAVLAVLVQLGLWAFELDWRLDLLFKQALVITPDEHTYSYLFAIPGLAVVTALPAAYWLAAQVGSLIGAEAITRATGRARCTSCGVITALPRHGGCPQCGARQNRSGIQWPAVSLAVGGVVAAMLAVVLLLGSTLGLYYRCNPESAQGECDAAQTAYEKADGWVGYEVRAHAAGLDGQAREPVLMLLHKWKYLGIIAGLLFVMAGILAARVVLAEMATAMIAVLLSWLAALVVGIVLFSTPSVEGSVVTIVQLHLLALIAWVPVGLVGAVTGQKLRPPVTEEMLDAAMGD
jgi:hypothetical protein